MLSSPRTGPRGQPSPRTRIPGLLGSEPSLALSGVLGGAAAGLVGSLLVARFLPPGERGHYATVVVFAMLALACLQMGGEVGVVRGMTDAADGGVSFLAGYLRWTLLTSAAAGVGVTAVGVADVAWLRPVWLVSLCAAVAMYSGLVARMTAGILVSGGRLRLLIVARTVANSGTIPGCCLCMALGLTSALQVATLSFVAQAMLNSALLMRVRPAAVSLAGCPAGPGRAARKRRPRAGITAVWGRGNVHLHVLTGITYALQRSDQMALSVLGAERTLGLYAVAMNVSEVVGYLPAALYPLLSRGRPGRSVPVRGILALVAVCVLTVTPLAYLALPFLYGDQYRAAQPVVLLLVPASGIFAVGLMVQGAELRDPGRRMHLARITLAAALVEFVSVILVGEFGVLATSVACIVGNSVYAASQLLTRKSRYSKEKKEGGAVPKSGFFTQRLVSAPVAGDRDTLLLDLCAGRRVLHIGCADSPLSADRLKDGSLLHAKLLREASAVHGVDVDRTGIELLRDRLGGEYSVADVADPEDRAGLVAFRPEIILAGDVIEHARDAASFLRGLAALMQETGGGVDLILSTPNGLAVKNLVNTLAGLEIIHPDHVYVFTPASLSRLVADCGLRPDRWAFYHVDSGHGARARVYDALSRIAARVRPAFAEGQVLICRTAG